MWQSPHKSSLCHCPIWSDSLSKFQSPVCWRHCIFLMSCLSSWIMTLKIKTMSAQELSGWVPSVLFVFIEHEILLKMPQVDLLSHWKPHIHQKFVFSSPSHPRHCVTQSTEVLGRVAPKGWLFLQVEGGFTPPKFSLKTFDAWNKAVSRCVLQEKLESLIGVLHVPEEIGRNRRWVVAPQLQTGSFRNSDAAVRLGHQLGSRSSWNISAVSVRPGQTYLLKEGVSIRSPVAIPYFEGTKRWNRILLTQGKKCHKHWYGNQAHDWAVKKLWDTFLKILPEQEGIWLRKQHSQGRMGIVGVLESCLSTFRRRLEESLSWQIWMFSDF